jgi:hypothetical protein
MNQLSTYTTEDGLFHIIDMRFYQESSQTVIVVTASVKEDERGGQGHTFTSLSLPLDTAV